MPKLDRWIIASREVDILDKDTDHALRDMGALTAGGWNIVHQHVLVTYENKEKIERYMASRGYNVRPASDTSFFHPDHYVQGHEMETEAAELNLQLKEEQYAMLDSFRKLHSDFPEGLLSDDIVDTVCDNAEKIAKFWFEDVYQNETTTEYREMQADILLETVTKSLTLFGQWMRSHDTNAQVAEFYTQVGRDRRQAGLELHEVLSAVTLLRKQIFVFAATQGLQQHSLDIYKVLEFNRRLVIYFDKALYHITKGYGC